MVIMHELWLNRNTLIHTIVSSEVAIAKLNITIENSEETVDSVESLNLVIDRKQQLPLDEK